MNLCLRGIIHLVRSQTFHLLPTFLTPLIHTPTCLYQDIRNIFFRKTFANTLNQWSQIIKHKKENINSVKIHFSQNTDTLFYMLPNLPSNFDPINNLVVFIVVFRKPKSYQKFHITFRSYNFLPKRTDFIDYLISCKYYISTPPENIRKPKLFWHFQGV